MNRWGEWITTPTENPKPALQSLPLSGAYCVYQPVKVDVTQKHKEAREKAMQLLEDRQKDAYARAFDRCPELKAVMQEGMDALLTAFAQKNKESYRASFLKEPKASDCHKANDDRIRVVVYQFQARLDQFLDHFAKHLHEDTSRIRHVINPALMLGAPVESCMRAMNDVFNFSSGVPKDFPRTAPLLLQEMGFKPFERTSSIEQLSFELSGAKKELWINRCEKGAYQKRGAKEKS